MDEELRTLERAARARPDDLIAGRAHAEGLRRRGDRRGLFGELSRLGRLGEPEARREVSAWVPWPGPSGPGNTAYRPSARARMTPSVDSLRLPGGPWRVVAAGDAWLLLLSASTLDQEESRRLLRVEVGERLEVAWGLELGPGVHAVQPWGDDLLWVDRGGRLHQLDAASGASSVVTRAIGGSLSSVEVAWDLALIWRWEVDGSTVRQGWTSLPLRAASSEASPHPHREYGAGPVVRGRLLTPVRLDEAGGILPYYDVSSIGMRTQTRLELADPATGEVLVQSEPFEDDVEVMAWDDRGLLLSRGRRPLGERAELSTAWRWTLPIHGIGDGWPPPVFGDQEVVFVDAEGEQGLAGMVLRAVDRASGTTRWTAPYPLGAGRVIRGGIAGCQRAVYLALELDDHVRVLGLDVTDAEVIVEARLPHRVRDGDLRLSTTARSLQLVPIEGGLLVLMSTTTGPVLARLR